MIISYDKITKTVSKDALGVFKTFNPLKAEVRKPTLAWAWLRAHRHEYPGQWLAVSGDRLIARGTSYDEVRAAGIAQVGTDFMLVRA